MPFYFTEKAIKMFSKYIYCAFWMFIHFTLCANAPHHTTAYIGSPNTIEVVPSYSHYSTNSFWDAHGNKLPIYDKFQKDTANLYVEYTVCGKNSLWAFGGYDNVDETLNRKEKGVEDLEIGWKSKLFGDETSACATQLTAIIPIRKEKASINYGKLGMELGIIYSDLFDALCNKGWYDLYLAYRFYDGHPSDVIRVQAALGYCVLSNVVLLAEGKLDYGLNKHKKSYRDNYIAFNPGYRLIELQYEGRWEVIEGAWLIIGGFHHVWGRNIGTGGGGFGGAWFNF